MGNDQVDNELEHFLATNSHLSFIENDLKNKIQSILNPNQIQEQYKKGRNYYDNESKDVSLLIPDRFKNNETLKEILKKAFQTDISPVLADLNDLKGLPKGKI